MLEKCMERLIRHRMLGFLSEHAGCEKVLACCILLLCPIDDGRISEPDGMSMVRNQQVERCRVGKGSIFGNWGIEALRIFISERLES